ncbi:LysR family transcriptional regulator, partial [Psychrobacter sp. CAL346-MNA-CIBAN-0220]|uniref:helix-turn-helix domain-containing protein n=1 Tax=Psychrobacter sp. CAL346-MNA-CIBAN-0220 TaxID=3140457 RepID=UPI00387E8ED3
LFLFFACLSLLNGDDFAIFIQYKDTLKLVSIGKNDMYSIEQLEAFVLTVNTGSFSSAARSLNKAQSVVSQHVINLEIDCNSELFDRSGR